VHGGSGFMLRVNQSPLVTQTRCLTALPGENAQAWNVDRGLFGGDFGDYPGQDFAAGAGIAPPQDPPTGPHQNFKVVAEQFPGLVPGREVVVVRVEVALDPTAPASVDVALVDAFNAI